MELRVTDSEIHTGVPLTHKNIYSRVKEFKRKFHEFPEPIIWFTKEYDLKGEVLVNVHYGNLDEYRGLGYGEGNDPDTLLYSLGTGVYYTLTQELESESVSKIERFLYNQVQSLVV